MNHSVKRLIYENLRYDMYNYYISHIQIISDISKILSDISKIISDDFLSGRQFSVRQFSLFVTSHDTTMPVVKLFQFSRFVVKATTCFASLPKFFDEACQLNRIVIFKTSL